MNIREVQAALLSRGYDPGPVDGLMGLMTRAAIVSFQRAAGLYPDGVAGPKTWLAFRAGNPVEPEPAPPRQSMSAIGIAALIGREARRLTAYLDSVGIWTIGIGHTAAAGAPVPYRGLTITRPECDAIFARDIVQYEDAVRRAITVSLAEHQFDALGSICYNIGTGGLAGSSFVKLINTRAEPAAIRKAILAWKKPSEIISRRTAEAAQFQTPYSLRLPKARSTDAQPIKVAA
ncbi:Lysozyme [Bosea sp. LC85]|uniref:glycoside hydrolase family protein n=1 Tax=Bosea sp. LC85 TaxID=1502851 RepID=UPI0004E3CEC9|nr:peptidoglycan-binding protein [Bosea sp. LC85]KFC73185.1 Lysozyme [Bosea sp. LC85]